MTNSEKNVKAAPFGVTKIENAEHFHDVFADITGVTEYNIDGTVYVNLSFLSHRVFPYADESGHPSSSRVDIKRVASVTLTRDKAIALRNALNANLSDE
ncbi:hypothetical protein ACOVH1_003371 [Klebsiella pneumoniae]|uniref:hypothetical protein n=1 Tax=Klebsiella TaxID=570 RepID=UPI00100BC224|nr:MULTISPECIES: hypothetical protein [Klebsiella]EIM2928289.1 hypothetical protein [Escherichia coli]HBR1718275.1 hypothetical protein [Klebsiella quasipneumoniae subsp. quasipneumoniae]HBU8663427.1 hypothetical protein [Klebsiella oxytoca]HCA9738038.1 hypothetical protein [Klebsiella variicola subsp. variicola]HDT2715863.1 hypothetical protein [Klebsiella pneumoniae subsp. ozaenae]